MATIGSNSASAHIIEQVTFDFSFVSEAVAHEHESRLSAWVVDTLLPIVEAILNEHDEADNVLCIEQITLDLGEISSTDYFVQIAQRLQDQLARQLSDAKSSGHRQQVVLPFSQSRSVAKPNKPNTVLHVKAVQSDFDRLAEFLLTGNLPWFIDTADAHVHEKLMEQVLREIESTYALRALLTQMPQTSRAVFIWRMANQFSHSMLETLLRQIEPQHHRLLLGLIKAFQSVLSASALPTIKYTNAMAVLWARILDGVARHAHLPHSAHFSTMICQLLQTMANHVLHEEETILLNRLINAVRIQEEGGQLPEVLSMIAKRNFQDYVQTDRSTNTGQQLSQFVHPSTIQTDQHREPVNQEDTVDKTVSKNLSLSLWLYRRIVTAMQQAGVSVTVENLETEQSANTQAMQARLQVMLQDAAVRAQLIAMLPRSVLMDIVFMLSPQAVFIIEQFNANDKQFYRYAEQKSHITDVSFEEWLSRFWDNALRFVAESPLTNEFAAAGFMRALTQGLNEETDDTAILQLWYEDLELVYHRKNSYESRILQNMIADAMARVVPRKFAPLAIPFGLNADRIPEALAVDFQTGKQRLRRALDDGQLIPEQLSEVAARKLVLALLKYDPEFADADSSVLIDAVETHARQARNLSAYYQQLVEKLLQEQVLDFETVTGLTAVCTEQTETEKTHHYIDPITQRIVSALQNAAITGTEQYAAQLDNNDAPAKQKWLLAMFSDPMLRKRLIAKLPEFVLIDVVYKLSPQAANILAQVLVRAETLYQSTPDRRARDVSVWKQQTFDNMLGFLSSKPHSRVLDRDSTLNTADFLLIMTRGLSASHGDTATLQSWHDGLRRTRQSEAERDADNLLESNIREAMLATPVKGSSASVIEEMYQITTDLENDFARQLLRLRSFYENGRLFPGSVPESVLQFMINEILKQYPETSDSDRRTLVDAIDSHARHSVSSADYYYQLLKKLVYGEDLDLEAIALHLERQQTQRMDVPSQSVVMTHEPFVPTSPHKSSIWHRLQNVLKQAGISDLHLDRLKINQIASVRVQLARHLLGQNERQSLIAQLWQTVLLDISYVLSPQAAFILAQLTRYADVLIQHTENIYRTTPSAWQRQLWNNALFFLADTTLSNAFNVSLFLQALTRELSGNADAKTILQSWCTALQKLQSEQYGYATNVLENFILDAVSLLPVSKHQAASLDQSIDLITEMQTADYHTMKERLRAALDGGRLIPALLSEATVKAWVLALLERDSNLTENDRYLFIESIESHWPKSGNSAAYFWLILRQLLLEQPVDLETIATQAETAGSAILDEPTDGTIENENPIKQIGQRIGLSLQQVAIVGADRDLEQFVQLSQIGDALAYRESLLTLLDNTALHQQLIEKLPESILLDIAYLVSPQSALILSYWLSHAEFFRQYVKNMEHATRDVWIKQLWKSGLQALCAAPDYHALDDLSGAVKFVSALIQDLAGSTDALRLTRLWHNALTMVLENSRQSTQDAQDNAPQSTQETVQGIRVLQHLLHGVLIQHADVSSEQSEKFVKMDRSFNPLTTLELNADEFEQQPGDEYYIHNAGLVMVAPYLPRLFRLLGWLDTEGSMDIGAADRAVHLLQFIVSAEQHLPEYQLVLNKILCGLPLAMPISREIDLNAHERGTVEDMLRGIIQNWRILGKTSISGLRETFLQRQGRFQEDMWHLTIAPGPFDMLLDQLPWSFSVIKHSWMSRAIHVTWR